jgi:lipid A 3-O-deacylase
MNPTEVPGVTIVSLLLRACIKLAVFALLLPALSWAETPTGASLAGLGISAELGVAMAEWTEALAAQTIALSDDSRQNGTAGGGMIRPEEGFRSGSWHLGLMSGYSISHGSKLFSGEDPDLNFVPLLPQIGYTITDVHGSFPIRGSLELILEPVFMFTTSPGITVGGGASLLARYNFVTGTRWVPFLDFGLGILYWDLRLPQFLGSQFDFTIQGGPGLHYFTTDHLAVTGQVRLHHISNGGIDSPNRAVNSSVFLLGVSYFF